MRLGPHEPRRYVLHSPQPPPSLLRRLCVVPVASEASPPSTLHSAGSMTSASAGGRRSRARSRVPPAVLVALDLAHQHRGHVRCEAAFEAAQQLAVRQGRQRAVVGTVLRRQPFEAVGHQVARGARVLRRLVLAVTQPPAAAVVGARRRAAIGSAVRQSSSTGQEQPALEERLADQRLVAEPGRRGRGWPPPSGSWCSITRTQLEVEPVARVRADPAVPRRLGPRPQVELHRQLPVHRRAAGGLKTTSRSPRSRPSRRTGRRAAIRRTPGMAVEPELDQTLGVVADARRALVAHPAVVEHGAAARRAGRRAPRATARPRPARPARRDRAGAGRVPRGHQRRRADQPRQVADRLVPERGRRRDATGCRRGRHACAGSGIVVRRPRPAPAPHQPAPPSTPRRRRGRVTRAVRVHRTPRPRTRRPACRCAGRSQRDGMRPLPLVCASVVLGPRRRRLRRASRRRRRLHRPARLRLGHAGRLAAGRVQSGDQPGRRAIAERVRGARRGRQGRQAFFKGQSGRESWWPRWISDRQFVFGGRVNVEKRCQDGRVVPPTEGLIVITVRDDGTIHERQLARVGDRPGGCGTRRWSPRSRTRCG